MRDHLRSLMETIAAEPQAAQVALLDCYDGGSVVRAEMERATLAFEHVAATSLATDPGLPPAAAGGIVAGVERVVRVRVMDGRYAELPSLVGELTEWIVTMCEANWFEPVRLSHSPKVYGNGALRIPTFDRAGDDRSRILTAVLKLAASEGYLTLTPSRIRQAASVSRRAFDASFDSVSACFLEAIEEFLSSDIRRAARRAQGRKQDVRSREVIQYLAVELARASTLIHTVFSEVTLPGQSGAVSRDRLISQLANAFSCSASPPRQCSLSDEALAAATWHSLSQR